MTVDGTVDGAERRARLQEISRLDWWDVLDYDRPDDEVEAIMDEMEETGHSWLQRAQEGQIVLTSQVLRTSRTKTSPPHFSRRLCVSRRHSRGVSSS